MTEKTGVIILILMLIPYGLFSQIISIELERSQWEEIKHGLEMSHKNKELVEKLTFALHISDSIRKKDEQINAELDKKIINLNNQLKLRDKQIANLNKSISIEQHKTTLEQSKRWGLSAIAGAGYGVGSAELQSFIGIGISYNFLKF